jgi:hypothetical protein
MSEILTTLQESIDNLVIENITVVDAVNLGFTVGDYIQIGKEIFEIRTPVNNSTLYVRRGLFGSTRSTHNAGSIVKRLSVVPQLEGEKIPVESGLYETVSFPVVPNISRTPPDFEDNLVDPQRYFPPDTSDGAIDPNAPTLISYNESSYEIIRKYGTLQDPTDAGSVAGGKVAIVGTQDGPNQYVAVDVAVEIASNISKNETSQDTIKEYTSFYSRPNLWRSGGKYDVSSFDDVYHYRTLSFPQESEIVNQTIASKTATFFGDQKNRIYLDNLSDIKINYFVVQETYFPTNLEGRSRIVGFGTNYIDLNTQHNFDGTSITTTISIVDIRSSDLDNEFGYYFNGPSVNFGLVNRSYGFYYGDSGLSKCSQPTHPRWGVFVETDPWNPCDPNSGCSSQEEGTKENQAWNFFEDLTLFGDYRSIGSMDEFHPEPLVQILRPKHSKRGLYVKDTVGIGTTTDRRVQLFVDFTNNPCPDKTHALGVIGTSFFSGRVGIATTNPQQILDVVGNGAFSGTITAPSFIGNVQGTASGNKLLSAFDIPHVKKKRKRIRHIIAEGPEAGIYVRGKLKDSNIIEIPEYWDGLVDPESITATLTQIGHSQDLIIEEVDFCNTIKIKSGNNSNIHCYYEIWAARWINPMNHEEKLHVVYDGKTPNDYPGDNRSFLVGGWDYDKRSPEWN